MASIKSIPETKARIWHLYQTNPRIHIDVTIDRPKLTYRNNEVLITGVYRNLFQIEEYSSGKATRHTLSYSDVLIKRVVIHELAPDTATETQLEL